MVLKGVRQHLQGTNCGNKKGLQHRTKNKLFLFLIGYRYVKVPQNFAECLISLNENQLISLCMQRAGSENISALYK